jgi:hypothetical protein
MVGIGTLRKRGASMSGHFRREESWNSAQGLCEITIDNRAKDKSSVGVSKIRNKSFLVIAANPGSQSGVARAGIQETRGKLD